MRIAETWFLWIMLYSVMGWIYETILCSVGQRRFINRGFLNGPYCPIYGFGAALDIVLLSGMENTISLFVTSALLACLLEYMTSWGMEKLFHARWWDYSKRPWNLNGRICFLGAIVFGFLSVLLMKLIHPYAMQTMALWSDTLLHFLAGILFTVFMTDVVYTVARFSLFDRMLNELSQQKNGAVKAINRLNSQIRRMIRSFPELTSTRYNALLSTIRARLFAGEGKRRK